ncbi:hypothetical protein C8R47DRAFT_1224827 [Mycena vitilis]|nr:hypothetical protein C8R47DRAFT_1224827 [Mycena vitilis]
MEPEEPLTLTEIDVETNSSTDSEADADPTSTDPTSTDHLSDAGSDTGKACDFCSTPLAATARFFRCCNCDDDEAPTLQCEKCCFELHLCRRDHELQEWNNALGSWVTGNIDTTRLGERLAVHCGSCSRQLAPPGRGIPRGTVHCGICDSGVLCYSCCRMEHKCKPLHRLRKWTGDRWRTASLDSIGYTFQMGHRGDRCVRPAAVRSPLMVIDEFGCQFLTVRYCACGKFRAKGSKGRWQQIFVQGWFKCTLQHPGACSTFKVQ